MELGRTHFGLGGERAEGGRGKGEGGRWARGGVGPIITRFNSREIMAVIEIRNLEKSYRVYQKQEGLWAAFTGLVNRKHREVRAVRGIDLDVEQGEFVAFLGPNGAGKTTTLKLLSGVINPTGGEARVLGFVPWQRENAYRRRFALVMGQKNQLWWDLPAAESFRLHQQIYGIDAESFRQTHDELVDLLDVRRLLNQPVRELSLGERMKMELIAAMLHSPDVLFLDEPTIGLDVIAQHNIQKFLKHYQEVRRITILLTSHYMKDVAALCRRVVVINHGQIIYDGSLDGIIDQFSSHKVLTLQFGDGRMPSDLSRYGDVLERKEPEVKLRVERNVITHVLSAVLADHVIEDISVEDPPLEEVIAQVFSQAGADTASGNGEVRSASQATPLNPTAS
jgi:viologen exporter family transport system ATP-binding protein